jgi:ATP-dependent DNA helicase DinG
MPVKKQRTAMQSRSEDYVSGIRSILGPEGVLAKSMAGYEHREQQVRMALEVFEALESGDCLVIEAPTGTGKTLAYLVAAVLSRKRMAISTGTKNLQEQLFFKDVPFVREKVFPGLKAALLKGRGNFVCHTRFKRFLRQPSFYPFGAEKSLNLIRDWYRTTCLGGEGDRAEIHNLADDDPVWPEICSSTETCAGKKCTDREDCFIHKMRLRAVEADLMIVNHHLLASDLAVREAGFGEVIPRYEALVVDEAHGLEDAVTQHFGFHVSLFRVTRLVRDARAEISDAGVDVRKIENVLAEVEERGRRLFHVFEGLGTFKTRFDFVDPEVAEIRGVLCGSLDVLASMLRSLPEAPEEPQLLAKRAATLSSELKVILSDEVSADYACWAERRDRSLILHASPVEVGEMLRSGLYEKVPSIVFTSATLSSGGTFDYFRSRMGLDSDPPPRELILDSPFDYAAQTMLYIPRSMPDPNSADFTGATVSVLEEILTRTRGRAFVLFTSHRNMEEVHKQMVDRVPFPLLVQGSKPKSQLLNEFRERQGSVLFATASFWEGVDVQGEALSCVIVDRLPFASPGDPIVSARVEKLKKEGKEPFSSFQVPMAVLALKQGLGRLIRTRTDRGILCILDTRILTRSYGRTFRKSLYSSPLRQDLEAIEAFFGFLSDD